MTLHDYLNEQEIISAMSEIMELHNTCNAFRTDRDQLIEILNVYFNTNNVSMVRVLTDLLDSNGYVIEDQDEVIHILVKYFGIPKVEIKHKQKEQKVMYEEDFPPPLGWYECPMELGFYLGKTEEDMKPRYKETA